MAITERVRQKIDVECGFHDGLCKPSPGDHRTAVA
jgi:hypothetical protein